MRRAIVVILILMPYAMLLISDHAHAAVLGPDDRDVILVKGPEIGLTADQIENVRSSTGYVFCEEPGGTAQGSGVLVRNNMTVLTDAHVIAGGTDCYFQNQAEAPERADADPALTFVPRKYFKGEANYDYAILTLKTPILGARPFDFSTAVSYGETVIKISSLEDIPVAHPDPAEPIVQRCSVKFQGGDIFVYTDCDASHGASGGPILAGPRQREPWLSVVGLTRGGLQGVGLQYSIANATQMMATQGSFAQRIELQAAMADVNVRGFVETPHNDPLGVPLVQVDGSPYTMQSYQACLSRGYWPCMPPPDD